MNNAPSMTFAYGLVVVLLLAMGCGGVQLAEERDDLFSQAVEASLEGDAALAARAAYQYQRTGSVDDSRYDRAGRLMADNLKQLELSHAAALWYHDIASARRDAELVEDAILGLAEVIENYPHDQWTLVDGFLATAEMPSFGDEASALVAFYQGRHNLRQGHPEWASDYFGEIPDESPYKARARYVLAVEMLADYRLDEAAEEMEMILEEYEDNLPDDVHSNIQRSLARIAFEKEEFEDALDRYQEIRQTAPDDPQLLLEMAWTKYYLNNHRRSLGLLLALDAPAYRDLIAPERFLLEAFNLQRLCQFEPARIAAVRLGAQYGEALDDLHSGMSLQDSDALLAAARLREVSQPVADHRARLELELQLVNEYASDLGENLTDALTALYQRGLKEADRREREHLRDETEALAAELLQAEQGVQLVLHEISVTLLRGRDRVEGTAPSAIFEVPRGGEQVYFQFGGEFWTDEIDDLIVPLEDRCIE